MLAHGDELGRTQGGNNNVYCQDNEISWVDWDGRTARAVLTEFTAPARPAARRAPDLPSSPVLPGPLDPRLQHRRHRLAAPRRAADERGGLERAATKSVAIFLNGQGIPDRRRARRTDRRRLVPAADQCLPSAGHLHPALPQSMAAAGRWSWIPPTRCWPMPDASSVTPCQAAGCGCRRERCSCSAADTEPLGVTAIGRRHRGPNKYLADVG